MKGKERETALSETQLKENLGSGSPRSIRVDTLLTRKDVRVMVTLLLKDYHCSFCDPKPNLLRLPEVTGVFPNP